MLITYQREAKRLSFTTPAAYYFRQSLDHCILSVIGAGRGLRAQHSNLSVDP
jgi:hypothetical protein